MCVCVCVYIYLSKSWHHRLKGHEFEQTPGARRGQRNLVCCSSWGSQRVGHNRATEQKNLKVIKYIHTITL